MPAITIDMDERDFERITHTSMEWGQRWAEQAGRFEHATEKYDVAPSWDWKMAYWVGTEWVNIMMARSYLRALGHDFEIVWDMVENPDMSYIVLTNYETESWKNR